MPICLTTVIMLLQKFSLKNYNITISDGFVYAKTADGKSATAIPVSNITGQIKKV